MPTTNTPPMLLSDAEMDALEAVLVSEDVPEDCMDLEMLDGFLAGVLLSPKPIKHDRWLPEVWTAHGEMSFGASHAVQNAIRLILGYYNEIATTLGREDEDERWQPFCFAAEEGEDKPGLGDAWIDGFLQGLDLWAENWQAELQDDETAREVQEILDQISAPWGDDGADAADDELRLSWLAAAGEGVNGIFTLWRSIGLPAPAPLERGELSPPGQEAQRNAPCPCGSGKKYKKCCGADRA